MGAIYRAGMGFVVLSLALVLLQPTGSPVPRNTGSVQHLTVQPSGATTAADWFRQIKQFCNALEVHTAMARMPPPNGAEGAGYQSACYSLAGRIERARELILSLPSSQRGTAAQIVFDVGHPVADAGDDESAGPIMELVLEFWPQNYMARYHAGMSAYILGRHSSAESHLEMFLDQYHHDDGWRRNALNVLDRLQ